MNPARLLRPMRLLLLVGIALTVGLYLRHRPKKFSMHARDHSMVPAYYPGSNLAVREIDRNFELRRGMDVLYAIGSTAYFGRVRGLPGDLVSDRDGFLLVNGKPIRPRAIPGKGMGVVAAGTLCILNINPDETVFGDSRRFGFIPRSQVRAIIGSEIK